jgi:hypothetical protein
MDNHMLHPTSSSNSRDTLPCNINSPPVIQEQMRTRGNHMPKLASLTANHTINLNILRRTDPSTNHRLHMENPIARTIMPRALHLTQEAPLDTSPTTDRFVLSYLFMMPFVGIQSK